MAEYAINRAKKGTISKDFFLAALIAASVIVGDFILRHLPW